MAASNPIGGLLDGDEAEAVENERIAGEHEEQQNALEHLGEIERHLERDLRLLAADEGQRQKQAGDQDADRIEPPQERNDDGGESVAGRNAGLQMADWAGDLDDAGEPGERARHREREQHELVGIEPGKTRRLRGGADDPDLEPLDGAAEHRPGNRHHHERHHGADVQPAAFDQCRYGRDRIELSGSRKIVAVRIAPRAAHQVIEQIVGDVNQHQADQDFARPEAHFAERRDQCIERTRQRAEHQHRRQHPMAGIGSLRRYREIAAANCADHELAFGADVPHIGEIAER
jgi:hypothetical protein